MTRPKIILDPHWRRLDELFAPDVLDALQSEFDVVWGKNDAMPKDDYARALPDAMAVISSTPEITRDTLETAKKLKVVIEVSGSFPDTIDYEACQSAKVEVLTCAPGFRQSVAEMGLAMALAGGRGLVWEHEAFRKGEESWLDDREDRDFTLFGAPVGFVGFGQIAQEIQRLMAPFSPKTKVFDPWLPDAVAAQHGVEKCGLSELAQQSKCLFVTAVPTSENYNLIGADILGRLPDNALVVGLSRAHLIDMDALEQEVRSGRIRAALDVFDTEPVADDATWRRLDGAILSPHRAAAVKGGRQLIGQMVLEDLRRVAAGETPKSLGRADPAKIKSLAGVGDAASVASMAVERS